MVEAVLARVDRETDGQRNSIYPRAQISIGHTSCHEKQAFRGYSHEAVNTSLKGRATRDKGFARV